MHAALAKKLPRNEVAERSVLGSIFIDNTLYPSVAAQITSDDFGYEFSRQVWNAFGALAVSGSPLDEIFLRSHLKKQIAANPDLWNFISSLTTDLPFVGYIDKYIALVKHDAGCRSFIRTGNQAIELAASGAPNALALALEKAQQLPKLGGESAGALVPGDDLFDAIDHLYSEGLCGGVSTGWRSLDEHYTVRKGEVTGVTGIPGMGKTTVTDALMVNIAKSEGWKFAVFSAENSLVRHSVSLMEKWSDQRFGKPGDFDRMDLDQLHFAKRFLNNHFMFIPPLDETQTLDNIIASMREAVRRGVDAILIDPWNEIAHDFGGRTETDYIDASLRRLRRFARAQNIHLLIVVHPAKMRRDEKGKYPVPTLYDISGSAHWRNKLDNGIVVWRDVLDKSQITDIYVQKIRFREIGKPGLVRLRFVPRSGRFIELTE